MISTWLGIGPDTADERLLDGSRGLVKARGAYRDNGWHSQLQHVHEVLFP
jgi:hypothetical protein